MKAYQNVSGSRQTPQNQPIPGRQDMAQNNAGGFVFTVDKWKHLSRFLILGSEGGTYYVNEQALTKQNFDNVLSCIQEDGRRVVETVATISEAGRAPRNTPAEFVLALCASLGDNETQDAAFNALPKVCRIGTHLFHFLEFVNKNRGWGPRLRRGVANWYNSKDAADLAYQVVKYQSRDGWSHKDALILAHPKPVDSLHNSIYEYVVKGLDPAVSFSPDELKVINGVEAAKRVDNSAGICYLINDYNLPRECIPTQWLNSPDVWDALLQKMPVTATIRNLGKMTEVGLLKQGSEAQKLIVDRITNEEVLKLGRVHPMTILFALKQYSEGHGLRGSLKWNAVPAVVDALDSAFYKAFGAVEPTGKIVMLALDISSSMSQSIMNSNLSCIEASCAMAMVTAAVEKNVQMVGFHTNLIPLDISPRRRLDDNVRYAMSKGFGGTDCAQPMIYAIENGINADAFVIYTDSETWAGRIHPTQALRQYRERTGINAKLAVVGMTSTKFTIADPTDAGMMDVVGMDTTVPNVMSDFIKE